MFVPCSDRPVCPKTSGEGVQLCLLLVSVRRRQSCFPVTTEPVAGGNQSCNAEKERLGHDLVQSGQVLTSIINHSDHLVSTCPAALSVELS